ncbi:unnamed protein product [Ilex paraguariensis]|uniref:Uncharacterized protein n=1 Tax=Ilex paraguariensis TaxID=185542 RepID=A0ABC8T6E2_9AQUA
MLFVHLFSLVDIVVYFLNFPCQVPPICDGNSGVSPSSSPRKEVAQRTMHGITFSTDDKPKLLSQKQSWPNQLSLSSLREHEQSLIKSEPYHLTIPGDGTDYRGTFRTQEVAIKVLKAVCVSSDVQREFAQEVYIMRLVKVFSVAVMLMPRMVSSQSCFYVGDNIMMWGIQEAAYDMLKQSWPNQLSLSSLREHEQSLIKSEPYHLTIPEQNCIWVIWGLVSLSDSRHIFFWYRGTFRTQEVAIKVLKAVCVSSDVQREFAQEVMLMPRMVSSQSCFYVGDNIMMWGIQEAAYDMLLTSLLANVGLNIQFQHDDFSLDVFVVDGWPYEYIKIVKEMPTC